MFAETIRRPSTHQLDLALSFTLKKGMRGGTDAETVCFVVV